MSNPTNVTVKFLVHREKNRVVFAESDKDFVDILFGFLTLPIGTIIRILGDPGSSSLGSLANLYESVASLDASHFETAACKEMLLCPRSAAGELCEKLAINIDDTNHRTFYACDPCCKFLLCDSYYYGSVPNIGCCKCGKQMDRVGVWWRSGAGEVESGDGVFVKKVFRFMVSDDLNVVPASTAAMLSIFEKLGITDGSVLEERILGFGTQEVANLLTRSLVSDNPLTDLCFNNSGTIDQTRNSDEDIISSKTETKTETETEIETETDAVTHGELKLKLILNKANNNVVYTEQGEILDLLFSFLTFRPSSSFCCKFRHFSRWSSLGSCFIWLFRL